MFEFSLIYFLPVRIGSESGVWDELGGVGTLAAYFPADTAVAPAVTQRGGSGWSRLT